MRVKDKMPDKSLSGEKEVASYFIGIVDGTGCWDNNQYDREMKNSFCRQLFESAGDAGSYRKEQSEDGHVIETAGTAAAYLRGPSGEGYSIERRARRIAEKALAAKADRTYLAGYSRGGSIAVIAARMLAERGVGVQGLFLFDPVARHGSASSDMVPGNVSAAYTARRAIGAKEMDKYDYVLLGDPAGHNPVRNWFGTTATRFESSATRHRETVEVGSHGALGGVGWKGVAEDVPCQEAVAKFFNQALREEQLPAKLVSRPPSSTF